MSADSPAERVSMADVAARAGVSVATVSLALQRHPRISEKTTERVVAAARALNYRPSPLLRKALRVVRGGDRSNGLVLAWIHREGHDWRGRGALFEAARAAAQLQGYGLEPFGLRLVGADSLRRILRARGIPGAILTGMEDVLDSWGPEPFGPSVRVVALQDRASELSGIPTVGPHSEALVRMTIHELLRRHYLAPGVVSAGMHQTDTPLLSALGTRFSAPKPFRAIPWHRLGVLGRQERLEAWYREYQPDCIVCDNDSVLNALALMGVEAPRDVGFLNLDLAPGAEGDFAGIDRRRPEIVKVAVQLLVSLVEHGRGWELELVTSTRVRPRWVDGGSLPFRAPPSATTAGHCDEHFLLPPEITWRPISLGAIANQPLLSVGGWFGDYPLRYLPTGRQQFAGVPFEILEDAATQGRSFIVLRSEAVSRGAHGNLPGAVRVPVGFACEELFVLHAAAYVGSPETFATYCICYADGSRHEAPVVAAGPPNPGVRGPQPTVHDWWRSVPSFSNRLTKPVEITAYGDRLEYLAHLYVWRWRHPHPRRVIAAIEIAARPGRRPTLGVIALTARVSARAAAASAKRARTVKA